MRSVATALCAVLTLANRSVEAALKTTPEPAPGLSRADLMEWTTGLGLVILLIVGSAWLLRRVNRYSFSRGNRLRILGGLALGTRERVVLLEVGETRLLLGVAPGRIETLYVLGPTEITDAPPVSQDQAEPPEFRDHIKKAMQEP
ncbi:MAG: flagellar biosynthetic protein FliO [Gammaproteobacteria bacterium]